ncbi:MAG: TonB-dependent receptor [Burkholderia sp.]|jgi:iron complex outermembrane receptor protein|uniref:TonB-dependent siderophore receptor n=1 Tax=Burkholderia sp. TaxID=36773 RepID=UPI00282FFCF7|nr:TonB-dependent receptor [Burkholderia sp.]MDR0245598.1 TonB-dependent receptor [Burkholderia sp.]
MAADAAAISLPKQPLGKSLAQLSQETGVAILAPGELVANRIGQAVSGTLSAAEALSRLLNGSGLVAERQGDKTWIIRREPPRPAGPASGSTTLPDINVTAARASSDTDGFAAVSTSAATRTDTPLAEIAQNVQVVTRDVLASQQAQTVEDALRNVSSVTVNNSNGQGQVVNIRGFSATATTDGFGIYGDPTNSSLNLPIAALDGIQVLKGADSILAGKMDPGGIVNVTTKRPQADPVRQVGFQVGSYGDWLASLDLAGAINDDKRLAYRFVVSGEREGQNFIGTDGKRNFYVAPSVEWKSGGTDLIVGVRQNVMRSPRTPYTVLLPSGPAVVDSPLGSSGDHSSLNATTFYYDFKQKLNDELTVSSKTHYDLIGLGATQYTVNPVRTASGGYRGSYRWSDTTLQMNTIGTDNSLEAKFRTGPIRHDFVGGWQYMVARLWYKAQVNLMPIVGPIPDPQLPDTLPGRFFGLSQVSKSFSSVEYLQDQMAWGPVHVTASLAHNQAWNNRATRDNTTAWTPNLGLVWQVTGNIGLYGNVLNSFSPQVTKLLAGGGIAPPQRGRSVEAGAKFSFLDDRLSGSIAAFRNAVTNATFADPTNPGFYILSAGSVSRGIELDITGRILPGWNVIGSYTYTSMINRLSTDPISLLPRHVASLWTTYDFQRGPLLGFGIGAGIWARSNYVALDTNNNHYLMPGQARVDTSLFYHAKRWSATFGVKNLFNRTLYGDYATGSFTEIVPTRLFYLSATHDF